MNQKNRIEDKVKDVKKYLEELFAFFPESFENYEKDKKIIAASERYFGKIIESIVDIGFLFVSLKEIEPPKDEESIFNTLFTNKIITKDLAERLRQAKGMRNFIIHEYGEIDNLKIYTSISEEIEGDIAEFIEQVLKQIN